MKFITLWERNDSQKLDKTKIKKEKYPNNKESLLSAKWNRRKMTALNLPTDPLGRRIIMFCFLLAKIIEMTSFKEEFTLRWGRYNCFTLKLSQCLARTLLVILHNTLSLIFMLFPLLPCDRRIISKLF